MVEAAVGEEEGVVGAAGGGKTPALALMLRLNVDQQVLNILIQIPHPIVAAVGEAVHVLGHADGAVVEAVTGSEHLAQVGDRESRVVEVGDEVAGLLVEAHLSALLQAHYMHHGVNEVVLTEQTLTALTGAGHGRVLEQALTGRSGRDDQEDGQ